MALANKNNPRRTSDFQGVRRAQPQKAGKPGPKTGKSRPTDLKRSSSAQDVAALLRSLRNR
jgi:hypothetical protein